jgi:hypothetical protein
MRGESWSPSRSNSPKLTRVTPWVSVACSVIRVHPVAMPVADPFSAKGFAAARVRQRCGQQHQLGAGRVGESGADPLLLPDDEGSGSRVDRQPPTIACRLVVVIDQHRFAVTGAVEAVQAQLGDFVRAAAGVDQQLDRDPQLATAEVLQQRKVIAEVAHHLDREVASSLGVFRSLRHVLGEEAEVIRHPMQRFSGAPQSHRAHPGQYFAQGASLFGSGLGAELAQADEIAHAVGERGDVQPVERADVIALVVALQAQALGELSQGIDAELDADGSRGAAATGQVAEGPSLGGVTQPWLADPAEAQRPGVAEYGRVPDVLVPLAFRCRARQVDVIGHGAVQPTITR